MTFSFFIFLIKVFVWFPLFEQFQARNILIKMYGVNFKLFLYFILCFLFKVYLVSFI